MMTMLTNRQLQKGLQSKGKSEIMNFVHVVGFFQHVLAAPMHHPSKADPQFLTHVLHV